ncbi:MAG: hypothetical protein A2W99_14675 [Bacteroidetes bacterium GWF2_33_16]|nr:MAG: hypothetical protein A2X00_08885 [Bacteroidetes bacterium GWE2_32_14]OFY04916.1 MAG: hypothetical protein A2W99_14675 [Bacteroidetes bacterium GWF2_33_16]
MIKKLRLTLILIFIKVFIPGLLLAQVTITGSVIDSEDNSTLPGVTVLEKNTGIGSITDIDGKYSIAVPKDAILVFSFVGYKSQEIVVGTQTIINVVLEKQMELLDEVIVIGYGTQRKSDKTGAVAQIKAEEMNGGIITDAIQAIQGKSAGVLITKKGGDPNEGFSVRIRGASGFDSNTQPLYVVDGVPGVDPSTVAPEDIETFNILKDAASAAIYGSRGSNGVVIINTKRGSEGNFKVQLNMKVSADQVANKLDLLGASDIRNYAQGLLEEALITKPTYTIDSVFNDGGANTDWQDEIFRTGISQVYNLNFSGGSEKSNYYASITQSNWDGAMLGTSKKRTIGKVNLTQKGLNDRLTVSGSISGTFESNDYENYGGWGKDDILYQAFSRNPTDPIYNADGTYYEATRVFNYQNPVAIINEIDNTRDAQRFLGNLKADLEIFKGLTGSVNMAYTQDDHENYYFRPNGLIDNGYGRRSYNNTTQKLIEVTGNYVKQLNENHTVNALLGYSWQELNYEGFSVQARDAQSTYLASNNLQALIDLKYGDIDSWKGMWRLIGFFGRVQYNYQQKYHLSASVRRDGSSKFGENNRWGWFPTVAIGWDIHKESFMAISWIDQLKLRLSYGTSGNQEIGEYRSQLVFQNSGLTVDPESGNDVVTFVNPWNANPNLKWEETTEYNLGVDYAIFNSRINGSLEVYYKRTTDLIGLYSVPKPPNLSDRTYANSGELESYGIELFVQSFIYDRSNFKWKSMLNLSHNTTKILDLGEYFEDGSVRKEGWISGRGMVGEEYYVTGIMEGEELGSFYLPTYVTMLDGVFVYKSEAGGYTDKLSEAKRTIVGTAAPDLEIGWSNTFTLYRNWDLDINFRSMIGNDVYNATEMFFDNPDLPSLNASPTALDWEEKGRVTGSTVMDIYVEDGSFVRLDYLALGYNFSSKKIKPISNLKIYIAANNLITITGYSGIDPETSVNGVSFGIDQYNVYPKTRTFSFGINATF